MLFYSSAINFQAKAQVLPPDNIVVTDSLRADSSVFKVDSLAVIAPSDTLGVDVDSIRSDSSAIAIQSDSLKNIEKKA